MNWEEGMNNGRSGKVILSPKGLERSMSVVNNDFKIVLGKREIECHRFQGAFLSKAIHRVLCSDNTVNEYIIVGYEGDESVLEEVSHLMKGFSIEINEVNCKELKSLFAILDNEEVLNQIIEFQVGKEEIGICNCLLRLKCKEECNFDCEEEIKFIASNFYKFDSLHLETFKKFKVEILERILNSANLCLKNEDSLVEFISSLSEEFSTLYDYVEVRFLSPEGIDLFLSSVSLENINICCWESICDRLRCKILNRYLEGKRFIKSEIISFSNIEGSEWNGILDYFTKECGGNVHKKRIVNITSSGDGSNKCWQVANYGWNDSWYSSDAPNSWICFDFKENYVSLQHYTLKSHEGYLDFFIEWVIEGSNDGNTWKVLDNRNTRDLCGTSRVKTYECSTSKSNEFFRFIRMRQTGKNSNNEDHLFLTNIELFGLLKKR
jgi:hypothetical protein